MVKTDVLVIGGGPAGIVAAVTAKKNNLTKKVILVRDQKHSVIPCGIPYIFNRLNSVEKNLMSDDSLKINKIDLFIDKIIKIDAENKVAISAGKKKIAYDKLILATGSKPVVIPIQGIDKDGVWQIKKDFEYLKKMRQAVLKAKNVVIIGGGYIGVELAEELSAIKGIKVNIVEKFDYCLGTTLDKEFTVLVEEKLKKKGVNIYTKITVKQIGGGQRVKYVKLSNGKKIPVDLVVVSIGAKPQVDIAKEAGIKLGVYGGIKVDTYMKTNMPDIFAVGDCAETRDFFTGKYFPIMLASTACYEARIAGTNLYRKKNLIENKGTLASFSTSIHGLAIGIVGLNEIMAKDRGFAKKMVKSKSSGLVVGISECPCHHPGSLPDTTLIKIKLIFSKGNGLLLGAQLVGPSSVGEIVNTIALAIQQKITAYELSILQVATHPLLTPAPTVYPLITAAQSVLSKLKK